jgi:hypothetical protein
LARERHLDPLREVDGVVFAINPEPSVDICPVETLLSQLAVCGGVEKRVYRAPWCGSFSTQCS